MSSHTKLLIVGASNKSTRSIARSLQKYKVEIHVLHDEDLAVSKSKYIKSYLLKPEIKKDIFSFKNEIVSAIEKLKIDVVLPSTDLAIDVVMRFKGEIEQKASIIGLNDNESYKYAHNKYELMSIGREVGLAIPNFIYVSNVNELPSFDNLVYPVVVKPISSARIMDRKHNSYKVSFPKNKSELIDGLRELLPNTPVMVQDHIEGYGIGYNVYCINGEIKSEYIHKRINENEGVSSYRKVVPIDSYPLKEKVKTLLQRVKWNGVGMIEFRVGVNGTPYLMEMNGRFFGSTEVGVRSGYDFPSFLFTDQYLREPKIVNNTGKFCSLRMLHDEVLLELDSLLRRKTIGRFFGWLFSLCNLVLPGNYLEDNYFNDPKFVSALYEYDRRRIRGKKIKKATINAFRIRKIDKDMWSAAKNIVFVCRGNICRSPFAEYFAKTVIPNKNFESVGTVNLTHRLSPLNALVAAKEFGVDLSTHSSKHIDDIDLANTDLFIVMDKLNYFELKDLNIPEHKIAFLAPDELHDPYKKELKEYESVYGQIKSCIEALI